MKPLLLIPPNDTLLGEGPVWDHRTQVFYWVDITAGRVHAFDWVDQSSKVYEIGEYVGAVVPSESGEMIMALHHGFAMLNLATGAISHFEDPESNLPSNRFNDGKCDAAGRFWAGTTEISHENPTGQLYCLDADRKVRAMLPDVTISNGLAWNSENTYFYYIDSPTHKIQGFHFDLATGNIQYDRDVIVFDQKLGSPDGMTIDEAGNLWIAFWGGNGVRCIDPRTGKELAYISVPASRTTSCAFGGPNMDLLFITSASDPSLKDDLGGGVFVVEPGVKGPFAHFFVG